MLSVAVGNVRRYITELQITVKNYSREFCCAERDHATSKGMHVLR